MIPAFINLDRVIGRINSRPRPGYRRGYYTLEVQKKNTDDKSAMASEHPELNSMFDHTEREDTADNYEDGD